MSTGLRTPAAGGRQARSASWVAADSSGTSSPAASQASAASTPGPPEFPTMATRRPAGRGWWASTAAVSKSCSMVSPRITPVWRNRASTARSGLARAAVWDDAPRLPAVDRPLLTAMIGLRQATRWAMRWNLPGFPKDSRYSRMTSVPLSSSQYCRRSLPLTSALLPTETKLEIPSPRRADRSRAAMPMAPDCEQSATRPGSGATGANVPFMDTVGAVLITPMQLGPITRMPWRWARRIRSRSTAARFGEAGRDHHDAFHLLGGALADDLGNGDGRHADDGQVDVVGDLEHGRVGPHPADVGRLRVDRIDRPLEITVEEVAEDLVADAARRLPGADDGDRPGGEEAADGPGLGLVLPLGDGHGQVGAVGHREADGDFPSAHDRLRLEARFPEDAEHLLVLPQGGGVELGDAGLPGGGRQPLQQDGADAPAVVVVVDQEGHFGVGPALPPLVAGDADDLVAQLRHQRHPQPVVQRGQVFQFGVGQVGVGGEVAQVDALGRQALVEAGQGRPVVGPDGTDQD